MDNFESSLNKVLENVYIGLKRSKVEWVIVGSAATRLQGIEIYPGDIDILMKNPEGVYSIANLMAGFALESNKNDEWLSSNDVPVLADEPNPSETVWHFGRWYVDGFKIEAAHIEPPSDYLSKKSKESGIWECGPEIWPFVKTTSYGSYILPIIPLEIQLETNFNRKLTARVNGIIDLFKNQGYDKKLLQISLSKKNMESFIKLID